jgi:hypothetical protein
MPFYEKGDVRSPRRGQPAGSASIRARPRTGSQRRSGAAPARPASGAAMPLTSTAPRSRYSKRSPTNRRVPAAMTTASGSAKASKRAARFGVSPTTDCCCAEPSPSHQPGGDANVRLRILENHDHRLPARQPLELPDQRLQRPVLLALRTEVRQRVALRSRHLPGRHRRGNALDLRG